MSLHGWVRSNAEYARRLANSGLEGASEGGEEFLDGEPLDRFLSDSARQALIPATVGLCVGIATGLGRTRKPASRVFAMGLLGGVIGLGAGFLWQTRHLTAGAARGVIRKTSLVRDERWFEKNPIDYA